MIAQPVIKTVQSSRKPAATIERHVWCERLLYAIVIVLVFEGLVRKVVPSAVGLFIFFIKDALCLFANYLVATATLPGLAERLNTRWKVFMVLLSPLLIYTAFLDLPLSVFAAKQYLLYASVALLVPMSFPANRVQSFKRFALLFALLLIPTTAIAILQNSLPATHWLNLSVDGASLQGFAAAGYLRVSSTFSFTGQYGWFLNAVCAFVIAGFFLPHHNSSTSVFNRIALPLASGVLLIIGVFITGGRTAVLGNIGCLVVGFALSGWKSPRASLRKGVTAILFILPGFWILHELKPEFFAAYEARSTGTEAVSNQSEMQNRILGGFTDWTDWYGEQDVASMLIGNGLGVMSNGSDRISTYAYSIRVTGLWMEGDVSTTVWEGGIYLMLLWYGFRSAIILFCLRLWLSIQDSTYSVVSSFLMANVIINGVTGNIAMQPPIAIWWWLSAGAIMAIYGFEKHAQKWPN